MFKDFWNTAISQVFGKQIEVIAESKAQTEIEKALGDNLRRQQTAWMVDLLNAQTAMGFKESPSAVTYQVLRRISRKNPVIAAIINTRVNQVASFAKQVDVLENSANKPTGYRVVHKRKLLKEMTKAEKSYANRLEDYISLCGYTDRFNSGRKRDLFTDYLKKEVRDRLTFDQMCFEKVPNRLREPAEFHAVDAATMRMASEEDMDEGIGYVQVVQGRPVNEYRWDEMAFCIANPITDIEQYGYGFSEIEQLISVITALFYSDSYNQKFFSQGLGVQGILNLVTKDGGIPPELLEAFKAQFQAQAAGVQNAWKTPVLNAEKVEFLNLKPNNRDMEYVKWVEYLIKIACAVYQISPEEINFESRSTGNTVMNEANPESKLKYSKDKGLRPLLTFMADSITEHLIEPYTKDYMFIFTGLDEKSEKETVEIRKIECESYKTLDEVRGESGLAPLGPDKGGDLIMSPQYIQAKAQRDMQDMMKQQGNNNTMGLGAAQGFSLRQPSAGDNEDE